MQYLEIFLDNSLRNRVDVSAEKTITPIKGLHSIEQQYRKYHVMV